MKNHARILTLFRVILVILFGVVACSALAASKARPHDPNAVPNGLTPADWNGIRAAHDAQRCTVTPNANGYRAHNPGQRWETEFDGAGFLTQPEKGDWRWGLELRSYGFPGHEQTATSARSTTADDQRVIYERGMGLSEWFVNDKRGLEHGFTVAKRPDGSGENKAPLQFVFGVLGNLRPVIAGDGSEVRFVNESGVAIVTYAKLEVLGADGRSLPAHFVTGIEGLILSVDESTARYPVTVDPIAQQAYVKASNTGAGDRFGSSIAISGDTVVVGAQAEASAANGVNGNQSDNSAPNAGAAYVFVRNGTTWTQQAYLKASNSGANDFFGISVAISGNTVVVGAQLEASAATGINGNESDNSATNAGAAYVFVRNGTTWTQQAYLKASNTEAFDRFGIRAAISGDTAVIGAIGEDSAATGINGNQSDNSATDAGAAYVFVRNGTTWTQQAYLKASNAGAFDDFGYSVAISGDTAVIGAWEESSAATGVNGNQSNNSAGASGAAYVFAGLPATAAMQNISTRAQVLTAGNVLIGGFIISGTGTKSILVRGLGATLGDLGVTGFLIDPTLDLRNGNQVQIATNDNWKDTQQADIQATGKAPPHDSESAILQTSLAPGKYTAILAGKNNTTGVGLVEVYDQSPASTAQLTNISSRGMVGTNSNVMIGGFVTGVAENRIIVRALGPTLIQFGVTGVLMDPVLGLFDANGNAIAGNDNWQQSSQASEIQDSGLAPPNAAESAIISIRPLGNTTAVVTGKNGTTGVALVEVY